MGADGSLRHPAPTTPRGSDDSDEQQTEDRIARGSFDTLRYTQEATGPEDAT